MRSSSMPGIASTSPSMNAGSPSHFHHEPFAGTCGANNVTPCFAAAAFHGSSAALADWPSPWSTINKGAGLPAAGTTTHPWHGKSFSGAATAAVGTSIATTKSERRTAASVDVRRRRAKVRAFP
jgi:hypothetical protein